MQRHQCQEGYVSALLKPMSADVFIQAGLDFEQAKALS